MAAVVQILAAVELVVIDHLLRVNRLVVVHQQNPLFLCPYRPITPSQLAAVVLEEQITLLPEVVKVLTLSFLPLHPLVVEQAALVSLTAQPATENQAGLVVADQHLPLQELKELVVLVLPGKGMPVVQVWAITGLAVVVVALVLRVETHLVATRQMWQESLEMVVPVFLRLLRERL